MFCSSTVENRNSIKNIRTLDWQGETPSHQTLQEDLSRYFNKQGVVGWCRELRCWLVRVPVHQLRPKDKMILLFGLAPPGEGKDWFEIRITPADTFLTVATCGRNVFIEAFALGLVNYFVLARKAAVISE